MKTKTAREIKVTKKILTNKNISATIGTSSNRESPETIYISISYWTKPSEEYKGYEGDELRDILKKELKSVYKNSITHILNSNSIFNRPESNFFIENIPDNFNYNNKRNYINFEIYLHTCNINSIDKIPLSQKRGEREIFEEALKVINFFGDSDILKGENGFQIFSSNR